MFNFLFRKRGADAEPVIETQRQTFERLNTEIALLELWPPLTVGPAPAPMIKDAWQVAEVARQLAQTSSARLAHMLDVDAPEEGWIFGLGFEDALRGLT